MNDVYAHILQEQRSDDLPTSKGSALRFYYKEHVYNDGECIGLLVRLMFRGTSCGVLEVDVLYEPNIKLLG